MEYDELTEQEKVQDQLMNLVLQTKENISKASHYDISSALPKFLTVLAKWQDHSNQLILEICDLLKHLAESRFITLLTTKKIMPKII